VHQGKTSWHRSSRFDPCDHDQQVVRLMLMKPCLPSLNRSADRAENNGEVKYSRLSPLVERLVGNRNFLIFRHARHGGEVRRVARDECALDKQGVDILKSILFGEAVDIGKALFLAHMNEWVLNPGEDISYC
jgi:hypothetical protein